MGGRSLPRFGANPTFDTINNVIGNEIHLVKNSQVIDIHDSPTH